MASFRYIPILLAFVCTAPLGKSAPAAPVGPAPGDTQVARWKDNKQAAFTLMFDDSIPSDVRTVVPELQKRAMVGVFYINPGGWGWKKDASAWEEKLPALPGIVYANHTFTHKGATSAPQLDDELRLCNEVIQRLFPAKQARLISFGRPGVKPENWTVTDEELKTLLAKYNLVLRPAAAGQMAMVSLKTTNQMLTAVDKTLDRGTWQYILFHGVGGDWIVTPTDIFVKFLDGLEKRRDRLWITDHISVYQYETERDSATIQVMEASDRQIRLKLSTPADPRLFDMPLTLTTRVPPGWRRCRITQGKKTVAVTVNDGLIQYDAAPCEEPITLQPNIPPGN